MIRINGVKLSLDYKDIQLQKIAAKKLNIKPDDVKSASLYKRSVDARKKENIHFIASLDIVVRGDENLIVKKCKNKNICVVKPFIYKIEKRNNPSCPPVIIGAGPAGLFAALILAQADMKPIVIERGKDVEQRKKDIENFWLTGNLKLNSNVQFGEGGAGTFSDGKLNTGTKDKRARKVLEEFVKAGAPKEILYDGKPHIGTDKLPKVIKNIRREIIALGGKFFFDTTLTDIIEKDGKAVGIKISSNEKTDIVDAENIVLAIGHSARDTFELLNNKKIAMEQKAFSIGGRIEHLQSKIDLAQYGSSAGKGRLGAADYKLAVHLKSGRGVYTFCMCPGGTVVAAASEEGMVVTNGMSEFARSKRNSNSALLVGVSPKDFGSDEVLAGIELQRKIERKAFVSGGGNYKAPVQRVGDFLQGIKTTRLGSVIPSYTAGYTMGNLEECLPCFITDSLKEGILMMDKKLKGFADRDAVITGAETRSSSPVRILRNERMESFSIKGLYPCGEGAGYAGGIISAAVDGIKCAEMIINKL